MSGALSSLTRVTEVVYGLSQQPGPLQGSSLTIWQCSPAWWCGRADLRVSYLSPTWEPRHLAFCPSPVSPAPKSLGAAFLFHFGQEE